MRAITTRAWIYIVISAALQVSIFPIAGPMAAWVAVLGWVALTPLLAALLLSDKNGNPLTLWQASLLGYVCGILWYLGNCYWIYQTMYLYGGLPKLVALGILVLFALYLGLYHALFALFFSVARRTTPQSMAVLVVAPFLWIAVELARARVTGFPWDLLGYCQVDNLLLTRLAPLAGVMAISFLLMAVNSALAPLLLPSRRRHLSLAIAGLIAAVALQTVTYLPALQRAGGDQPGHTVTMMQENLLVGAASRNVQALSLNEELTNFSRWSLNPLHMEVDGKWGPTLSSANPDLIVWPEAPSHLQSNDPSFRDSIGQLALDAGAPVIAGSLGVDLTPTAPRGYLLYDSASLFSSDGAYQSRYDKIHLVPWGEYIPFKQVFAFANKLTEGVGDMDPGSQRKVFNTGGHRYGVFICYESIFGDEVRQFAANGAEVLVNISDDGWYGETGAPWQHLNMARMRAIENDRWLLRSTNTGVTTSIDPYGRIVLAAPRHVRAAFSFPFDFISGETFYTRHGDWFAWLCTLVSVGWCALALFRQSGRKRID